MGRYRSRSRSRSYSPRRFSRSPPRRKRYDDPRDRYPRGIGGGGRSFRDRRSDAPSGLLIRNISLDARPEDLRVPFERFGPVRDVYLPKNYYTGEPRGFGFVKFRNAEDAAEAKHHMNHQVIGGREISIVYAEENRKTPQEMRSTGRISGRYGGGRRSPPRSSRSPRRRYTSYSRSPSPRHSPSPRYDSRLPKRQGHTKFMHRSCLAGQTYYTPQTLRNTLGHTKISVRERGRVTHDDYSPRQRSISPPPRKGYRPDQHSPSPVGNSRSPSRSRSYSPR